MINDDRLRAAVSDAPLVVLAIDADGIVRLFEGNSIAVAAVNAERALNRAAVDVFADRPDMMVNVRRALGGETFSAVSHNGERAYEGYYSPTSGDLGELSGMTAVLVDVTERLDSQSLTEQALADERSRSRRDSLTGALNHAAIIEALTTELACDDVRSLAIAMVDVDGLKAANDTWGHPAGDALLRVVAQGLAQAGAIVGRYGGDEFLAVLPHADLQQAERYSEAVLQAARDADIHDERTGSLIPMAISIGLALYPDEGLKADDLIKLADGAMYASRRLRRARADGESTGQRIGADSAARLVGEIVPLLTAPGSREEKLQLVAHQLSVGAGYDAVNFEVSGEDATAGTSWEGAYVRSPQKDVESWVREQAQATHHPLGEAMERGRSPIFINDLSTTELLTKPERDLLTAAGLASGLAVPMIWHNQLVGMLSVAAKQPSAFTAWDAHFLTGVASQVTAIVFMTTLVEELRAASEHLTQAHAETVMMLASAAEAHDVTTGRHLQRVRTLTEALSVELGYNEDRAHQLGLAAVLHDIGKIRVPDAVLASSSSLTDAEWVIMRQHTIWGSDFLDGRHGFDLAALVARAHHERWDGAGYPAGLKGEEIPEAAAITCVADTFDAMTNDRPYRVGRPAAEAVQEIVRCSGTQFSPRVVDALVRLANRGALAFADGEQDLKAA